ncbi:MAG: histidinol-phosphate transaminase [Thaumarchaeota archaeon]|nr:histidinol-phosphate transaminase [Nitrososphaerota archaeon]
MILLHKVKHGGVNTLNLGTDIIDFSSNVNPLGCPIKTINSLKNKLSYLLSSYPDLYSKHFYEKLSNYIGVSKDKIVAGNGSVEIIYDFCRIFLNSHMRTLIPIPTFSEYEIASKLQNCKIIFFKSMNLNDDLAKFLTKIPKHGCVFICNPNNPTGVLVKQKNMLQIIETAQMKSTILFIDECFIELTHDKNESILKYITQFNNLFVLRSLTKTFGLAGLRLGYGISNKKMIQTIKKTKVPWHINTLAQHVTLSVFNKTYLKKTRKLIKKEHIFLQESISKINNFVCYESSTNFILVKTTFDIKFLQEQLLQQGILIRNCNNFRGLGRNFFRIAIKTHDQNIKLIKSLEVISRKH